MTHQLLPGSLEVEDGVITGAVHVGPTEFDMKELRYVRGNLADGKPGDTALSFLARVYDASEGCLLKNDFRMKQEAV